MKKQTLLFCAITLAVGLLLSSLSPASAQDEPGYRISLRREFGYGAGSNIRGRMSLRLVDESADVQQVTYLMDGQEIAVLNEAPFKFEFHTDDYGYGPHDISALVTTSNNKIFDTNTLRYNFVTQAEETSGIKNILLPVGVVLIAAMGFSALVQFIGKPKQTPQPGQPRNYGMLGGTICPRCGHPFPRSLLGMNLVVGRLERCESCKRFVMTVRATPAQLAEAEAREAASAAEAVKPLDMEEMGKDAIEESKYFDSL